VVVIARSDFNFDYGVSFNDVDRAPRSRQLVRPHAPVVDRGSPHQRALCILLTAARLTTRTPPMSVGSTCLNVAYHYIGSRA